MGAKKSAFSTLFGSRMLGCSLCGLQLKATMPVCLPALTASPVCELSVPWIVVTNGLHLSAVITAQKFFCAGVPLNMRTRLWTWARLPFDLCQWMRGGLLITQPNMVPKDQVFCLLKPECPMYLLHACSHLSWLSSPLQVFFFQI